jgi:hypothetical protein
MDVGTPQGRGDGGWKDAVQPVPVWSLSHSSPGGSDCSSLCQQVLSALPSLYHLNEWMKVCSFLLLSSPFTENFSVVVVLLSIQEVPGLILVTEVCYGFSKSFQADTENTSTKHVKTASPDLSHHLSLIYCHDPFNTTLP